MEDKICQNCQTKFNVSTTDIDFYQKIDVPTPKLCPTCRVKRRLSFRNERTLYKRTCDLCKKDGVSIYPANTLFPVFCHHCWWSDKWDPQAYALDLDLGRPFLQQFEELKNKVPRIALLVIDSVQSDYTNNAGENKNCYLVFAAEKNEDCAYSRLLMNSKFVLDACSVYESELSYELTDCRKCYKCMFSEQCQECSDVYFSFDMRNCQNSIFCTHGRNVSYRIYNKPVSKEEFEKKKNEIFSSYENLEKAKEEYKKLRENTFVQFAIQTKCQNATGDYMYNCFDGIRLFDVRNAKDSAYMADAEDPIDCQDCNNIYFKPERCYQIMGSLQTNNSRVGVYIMFCNNVDYSDSLYHCSDCFGCVGLNKKNYCILNKQYTKEEYFQLREKIISQLKSEEIYGEFFPPNLSPFGYNETLTQEYYPLKKEEAINTGFRWQEETTGTYGKETITSRDIPQSIKEVTDAITTESLACVDCGKNYRITHMELEFYRRMNIPLPRRDFECRHKLRMAKRTPRELWTRTCMCTHENHGHNAECINSFDTAYAPERVEQIYCEDCYQKEVI